MMSGFKASSILVMSLNVKVCMRVSLLTKRFALLPLVSDLEDRRGWYAMTEKVV